MVTPKQYAQKHAVAYTTVMKWLRADQIPGASKLPLPLPLTGHVYQIPEDAPAPQLKPGPKPQTDGKRKRSIASKRGESK